jgi:rare lipoprotein A
VTRRPTASRLLFALVPALALAPAAARADDGSGTGGTAPPPAQAPASDQPPGEMAVTAPRSAFVRQRVRVGGKSRRVRRRVVRIERRARGGKWSEITRVRADGKGSFSAIWRPRRVGRYELRARVGRATTNATGGTAVPVEIGAEGSGSSGYLSVYEPAIATWYGPGFFGNTTACGIVLAEDTVGVAHRELPCGTQVQIAFRNRVVVVPVIDRGPFANGADWDLTQAAAAQLGMTETNRIGAMPLPSGG